MRRRRFLALGGTALLAGCLGETTDDPEAPPDTSDPGGDQSADPGDGDDADADGSAGGSGPTLSPAIETALGAIPESVDGRRLTSLVVTRPGSDSTLALTGRQATERLGVPVESVDRSVAAFSTTDPRQTVVVLVGSFDAADVDPDQEVAVDARDGLAIAASGDGGEWQTGLEAATAAADDPERGLVDSAGSLVARVQDADVVIASTDPDGSDVVDVGADVDALAVGRRTVEDRRQRTTYAVRFAGADAATESAVEEIVLAAENRLDAGEFDPTVQTDGRTVVASFVTPLPPGALPDDSPDIRFFVRERDGEQTLIVRGSEPVDPATLELRVDGEPQTPPWGDRTEPIESGESFPLDVAPLRSVVVWWLDPGRDGVEQPLGRSTTGADAFEATYRPDGTYVLTYTGEAGVDADRLTVSTNSSGRGGEGRERPLTAFVGDRLEPGDEVRIEDVEPGDGVSLVLEVDAGGSVSAQSVFGARVEPPGEVTVEDAGDGRATLTYTGPDQPAGNYRVVVDGEPADTQFADTYDTLTEGDRVTVQAALGDRVAVEWTAGEEPLPVTMETLTPEAAFAADYDPGAGELTVTYREGDPLDADALLVDVLPRTAGVDRAAWTEAYDTVEPGDSVTLSVDGDAAPKQVLVVFEESALLDRVDLSGSDGSE